MNPNQNQNPFDPQTPQPPVPPQPVQPQPMAPITPVAPLISPLNPTPTPTQQPIQPVAAPVQPNNTGIASPIDSTQQYTTTPSAVPFQRGRSFGAKTIVKLVLMLLLFGFAGYFIIEKNANDSAVMEAGTKVEGISTGAYWETTRKGNTTYKAQYEYENEKGYKSKTYGDKSYSDVEDVGAGKKATIYYLPDDPGKGTVVKDEE